VLAAGLPEHGAPRPRLGRPEGLPSRFPGLRPTRSPVATLYKRGSRYYLNWREGGVQYRRSLGAIDRKAAEALRAEKEAETRGLITVSRGVTVAQVVADYLAWADVARPTGRKQIGYALAPFLAEFADHPAESLDPARVELRMHARDVSAATVSKTLRIARAAFKRAVRKQRITVNPMDRVELPKVLTSRAPPWYTKAQLDALFKAEHGALWRFMACTGIRRSEAAKARRADVRDGQLYVESDAEGRTKSGKWRSVPLSKGAVAALRKLGKDALVPVTHDTLSDWFRADADAAGVSGTLHWLRHTFCTHLAQAGVSAHDICRLAGHSSIAVTERYMHHAPNAAKIAISKLKL
jgi:integrase